MNDDTSHPANPYENEIPTAPRLQDREGYPFAAPRMSVSEPPQLISVIRGKLRHMDPVKGYGFVVPNEVGPDVYLPLRTLRNSGFTSFIPGRGCGIEVEAVDQGRGMVAIKVRWVEWTP